MTGSIWWTASSNDDTDVLVVIGDMAYLRSGCGRRSVLRSRTL
jgi:hypothetical protein